ncbi:MAG: ABC transporter ATP-binding protein [Polyangiales bacterium]
MSGRGLQAAGLSHRFRAEGEEVLREVSLTVEEGEFVGILGPNGAGKSTLLRAAAGLMRPTEGAVTLEGASVLEMSARERARAIAYVPQRERIPVGLSVREYVSLGRGPWTSWTGRLSREDRAAVASALERTALTELAGRSVASLSGGEQRRCLTARALAQDARFALLDEPLASLDAHQQVAVGEILRARASAGAGVLAVLHEINLASQLCDRVIVLRGGRRVAEGAPRDALTQGVVEGVFPCRFMRVEGPGRAPCFVPVATR